MKLPYAAVEFTKAGTPADPAQVDAALAMLDAADATDVIIMSHGWNNDMAAARRLYTQLGDNLADLAAGSDRRPAIIGILWPSIQWADDDQTAGGGVSLGDDVGALAATIRKSVEDPGLAEELTGLTDSLDTAAGREAFLARARTLLDDGGGDEDAPPSALVGGDADGVFDAVRVAVYAIDDVVPPAPATGAPGVAPDLLAEGADVEGAGIFGMSWAALARQVLNTVTYYTMKARAGDVGANGVAPLVDRINAADPERRIHLVGHSFGARVVSAAATNITTPIESLTLLQGAFSHYGFTPDYGGSGKDGAFRGAIANGLIHGPVVITHTHNDRAVRLAYAVASRLAGQVGAGLGDRNDPYGGIGANGSVGTGATQLELGDRDASYQFASGAIHNLLADRQIASHGDVSNPAVANALAHAIGLR